MSSKSSGGSVIITDGSTAFDGGVNSIAVPTVRGPGNPNGLLRSQTAWMNNCECRDGGITQRAGWQPIMGISDSRGLYQGGFIYEPSFDNPYLVVLISGHVLKVDILNKTVTDLSAAFGLFMPGTEPQAYFVQAEEFLVIQAGDNVTLPLFWDGVTLRRSNGITGNTTYDNTGSPVVLLRTVTAPFTIPAIGSNVTVHLSNGVSSDVNSRFVLTDPAGVTTWGTFFVVSKGATTEVWKTIASGFVGSAPPAGDYALTLSSPGSFVANLSSSFKVPPINDTAILHISNGPYPGNVGDTASVVNQALQPIGNFLITAFSGGAITLKTISSGIVGATLPSTDNFTFTISSPTTAGSGAGINEIPAATAMDYFMQRLWYAQGRLVSAGDIVGGPSGTLQYNFRDSVLKVTENPLMIGGDGFTVPSNAGNIRAIKHNANLDTALGQGNLFIGTRRDIYSLAVPVTRNDWIAAGSNNQPLMTVVQKNNGMVNDRSVVPVNGDLFFQSLEPSIRSLISAVRYFQQWANPSIAANENRILQFNDRALLHLSTGILFDNRLLESALPKQLPQGVIHQALIPLDFQPISSFGAQLNPIWQGMYQGLQHLQLFTADFGGLVRAFSVNVSEEDSTINLYELTIADRFENGDQRVTWQIEFPAFTWDKIFMLKKLVAGELWLDKIFGEVIIQVDYRPDSDPCWHEWSVFKVCAARTSCETVDDPVCYPEEGFRESYKSTLTLPIPPDACEPVMKRPTNIAYQFQPRITITGWCRVRGVLLHAEPTDRELYANLTC